MAAQRRALGSLVSALVLAGSIGQAAAGSPHPGGFRVEVLVDGRVAAQYYADGTRYVEAVKGKEYAIRLHNPLDVRVAVALSVDGLNTIDARHSDAWTARKWVLDPHQTVTISGWQTSTSEARRFYFTSEERSYAARLGQAENLGVISAVVFRERRSEIVPLGMVEPRPSLPEPRHGRDSARSEAPAPSAPAAESAGKAQAEGTAQYKGAERQDADDYAATGIGRRTEHLVQRIHMDLERHPVAGVDIRYEYRSQLVRLGVLPASGEDPLARRQRARGFEEFCPVVK